MVEFTVYDRISFGHHEYDERGDVLYLSVADYQGPPARAYASPEGHAAEYDGSNHVIALTLVNVRWLLDRDGELTITWPAGHVQADELAAALLPPREAPTQKRAVSPFQTRLPTHGAIMKHRGVAPSAVRRLYPRESAGVQRPRVWDPASTGAACPTAVRTDR